MVGQGPSSLRSGESIGRHTISRVLGEGGMGTVYEAWHRDLEKRFAIKTLHRHYASSAEVRARFLREGQASSRIRHPNVVDVYDVALEGDIPYLVMEFLEGEDLSRFLAREGALSVIQATDVLLPVVSALAAAHELGVVHRDLKPENILLCNERGMIKPKVVDFGISKIINPDDAQALTGTAAMLGTPYSCRPSRPHRPKASISAPISTRSGWCCTSASWARNHSTSPLSTC
jgi:eukaryotic-like serine/threonine-protein kinase